MFPPGGFPGFDPSKMDPKVLMELSQLIQQLPSDKLNRLQTLMHNMMAGFDVRKELEELEKSLPPGFREKIMSLMMQQAGGMSAAAEATDAGSFSANSNANAIEAEFVEASGDEMNVREARMTVLRGVASGSLSPEEAERILFSRT